MPFPVMPPEKDLEAVFGIKLRPRNVHFAGVRITRSASLSCAGVELKKGSYKGRLTAFGDLLRRS